MSARLLLDPAGRRVDVIFRSADLERVKACTDVVWAKDDPAPADVVESVREDVEIIVCGRWRYGEVSRFPKLRAILEVSGGHPSPGALDYATCFSRGIRVLSCAPAFGPAVAEMALGLAISAARQIAWNDADFRRGAGNWSHTDPGDTFTLYGKPVGFIGFGGLAQCLLKLLRPFEAPVRVYDPWLTDAYLRKQGVEPVDLDTLLSTSRFIYVLAVPSASNKALLDAEKLARIASDAVFLLMSRSHVVDFDALTDLLLAGRFKAGIDVYPEEPLPGDHPIRQAPNVVFSTHRAGAIGEALQNIGTLVADDVEALSAGLVPRAMQAADPDFIRMRGGR